MNLEEILKNITTSGRAQNEALMALYRLKGAEFKRYFLHKGVNTSSVEDVLQETFVKIFKSASNYQGKGGYGEGSAAAWLHTIAFSCMQDYFEKTNRIKNESTPYDEVEHQGQLEQVRAAEQMESKATLDVNECISTGLENFAAEHPDRYQVLMSQLDGEDISSIGRRIGRSLAATKEYLSQCRKKLAPYIEHCTELLPA